MPIERIQGRTDAFLIETDAGSTPGGSLAVAEKSAEPGIDPASLIRTGALDMPTRKKTACVLCVNGCGLEIDVEDNQIVGVRGDKSDPRSGGYTCPKPIQLRYYQHNSDRLLHPLKRVGGAFERISWDQALSEIAEKLKGIVQRHGPKSLALMGGFNVGNAAQGPFAMSLLTAMGSQYRYNSLAQELTGRFWVNGETLGGPGANADTDNADMAIIAGKNPLMSHHFMQARVFWRNFGKDPDKILVVIDPRLTETAKLADIHLAIRPGTDALLLRAMTAIILQEGWHDQEFLDEHVSDFPAIRHLFESFDARAAIAVCELDFEQVREVCRLFTSRKACHLSDLGVLMGRHSTLVSYLETVLLAVSGRMGKIGGNLLPKAVASLPVRTASDASNAWRTVATDYRQITGIYPPNVMPEEILNDHPDRLRAVIVSAHNPLRSHADTTAFEEAFAQLDLLVTVDMNMSETAALSHYVLPAPSGYEKWDERLTGGGTGFRRPILEPEGEQLEEGEIFTRLADALGLIPDLPGSLVDSARSGDRNEFDAALARYLEERPEAGRVLPFILAKTLGRQLGSAHLASLWGSLRSLPAALREERFQAVIDQARGVPVPVAGVAVADDEEFPKLPTPDRKVRLDLPEMTQWLEEIDPAAESALLDRDRSEYPFILSAGRHFDYNANTQMRNPAWLKGKRACTLIMHPRDAGRYDLMDGEMVRVITEAGEETIELEVDPTTREGFTMIPHGFGLVYDGQAHGVNVNRLTRSTHRDRLAGTPLHRYIPCRVEAIR